MFSRSLLLHKLLDAVSVVVFFHYPVSILARPNVQQYTVDVVVIWIINKYDGGRICDVFIWH